MRSTILFISGIILVLKGFEPQGWAIVIFGIFGMITGYFYSIMKKKGPQ